MSLIEILLTLPALAAAVASATALWLHGSVFAARRAHWQAAGGRWSELTHCPLCVAGQFSLWFGILLAAAALLPDPWCRLALAPLYACSAPAPALLLYGGVRALLLPQQGVPHEPPAGGPPDDDRPSEDGV